MPTPNEYARLSVAGFHALVDTYYRSYLPKKKALKVTLSCKRMRQLLEIG
jgi:hypothetical protein